MKAKVKNIALYMLFLCGSVVYTACEHNVHSKQDLLQWMGDTDNGLVKSKFINGLKLTAKYLPPEYLTLNELSSSPIKKHQYDSIFNHYNKLRTFLLTIGPDDEKDSNIMFRNVVSSEDYKRRVEQLNFDVASFVSVITPSGEYHPVLFTFENTYELASHKSLYLVFSAEEDVGLHSSDKLDLKFTDELFGTGISHFVFDKNDIENIPDIKLEDN